MKKLINLMFILFVFPLQVLAAPDYTAAQKLVQETSDRFLKEINQNKQAIKKDPSIAYKIASKIVLPHFDIERMSKYVLSKNWRSANPEQKQRFKDEFKQLLLNTYSRSIVEYSDEVIGYLPFKTGKKLKRVLIRQQIKPATGMPIPIDYYMSIRDGTWKVIDVRIEAVSLVINYRSTFSRDIRKEGLDKFLDKLAAKNKQKKGG